VQTGLYLTLEGLCEVRGWLPRMPAEPEPFQLPAPSDVSAAQALRRALEPWRLGVRPYYVAGEPARWLSYRWDDGAPVVSAESLEALAAHYGVELGAQGRPS
jgi:hypothetical protein